MHRPTVPASWLARPRLLQRLSLGLQSKITLVSAPAGFGKSTLISAWLEQLESQPPDPSGAAAGAIRTSWLALEEADSQLVRFVRYLVAAIEVHFLARCAAVIALLLENQTPTVEEVADTLAGSLAQTEERLVLALDDLHLIQDAAIYALLARLITHMPPCLHLVLISRLDPPLPLSRWRARGQVHELRLRDLSFTLAETTDFLRQSLTVPPPAATIATLHERTEGWAVGLRLAALALRPQADYAAFAAQIEAEHSRYIVDYLVDDVLERQPPAVQRFLICTALLNRFCAPLCAALLETDEETAQQYLEAVARANLFLVGLSTPPYWYRYHHQFQMMLLSRLYARYNAPAIADLHRTAAGWLAAHGQVDEALRHLAAIPDFAAAAALIENQRIAALNKLRFGDLETWLSILPMPVLDQRPVLLISLAWVQFDHTDNAQCLATVQRAAERLAEQTAGMSEATRQLLHAEIVALRTALDRTPDPAQTLALIRHTWSYLRPQLLLTHCNVVLWFAYTCQRMGDLDLALSIVLTTLDMTSEWPQVGRSRLLHTAGFFYWCGGNLAQAERALLENLRLGRQHQLPLIAMISQHGLGAVADARHQEDVAEAYHLEVVKTPHLTNGRDAVMDLYSLIGIYTRRGRPEMARELVEQLKEYALLVGRTHLIAQVAALEAYVNLVCGERDAALRWALAGAHGEVYNGADRIPVIRARILLSEGSPASLGLASRLLEELSRRHAAEHMWHRAVEVGILQALTFDKLGQQDVALAVLRQAVQCAVPRGLVGPFIDQSSGLLPLLTMLEQQPDHAPLVRLLLSAFPADIAPPVARRAVQALPEPLTEREAEVLPLLAERLSNKEIALRLTVSVYTVRNHIANIFGKLQVTSRREAVDRACEIGLLPAESPGTSRTH
ncbi:MAG: hypothetical protein IT329_23160 [Caldilineaceae bacterium]|nr:hypothetical protein [Caldilineaceae bacterium]